MATICNVLLTFILGWTVVFGQGGHKDMSALLDTILKGYKPVVSPCPDVNSPVHVQLSMRVSAIIDLDTKEQMLRIRGHTKFVWTDTRLQWDPKDYGGILNTNLPQTHIWRPDMVFFASLQGDFYIGSPDTQLIIFHNGSVLWEPSFTAAFGCEVRVTKYPVDVSVCSITVCPWANFNSTIVMELHEPFLVVQESVANGQFDVRAGDSRKELFPHEGWFFEMVTFDIKLSRKPAHIIMSLLFPMLLSGLLGPLAFLIPPDDAEKVSVSVTVLLATAVFMGVIHDNLPDRSDETSTVAVYVTFLLVMAFLGVLGNTIVLLVHRKDNENDQLTGPGEVSSHCTTTGNVSNTPYSSLKSAADDAMRSVLTKEAIQTEKTTNIGAGVAKRRQRSRAEWLNSIFFISNTLCLVFITIVVFAYIFS